ncbi:MAG: FAD-dependent oxidoreductase, partial [Merismopedia sp. SIO2A8]|nr:FAD-dependent oxidoreductase [Merismopedia sp. SIO2A8]
MTQTNSKTNNNYDVVIVGAGIAGALAAYKLAQANKRVLILEAGTEVPSNRGDYMERFYLASAKTPESPYPKNLNALNATVLDIPNRGYLIQNGSLPFSSTNERRGG